MRIFATLAMIVTALSSTAYAADTFAAWRAELTNNMKAKDNGVAIIERDYRDVRCPRQATAQAKAACNNAFNMVIARRFAEKAELALALSAIDLPDSERTPVLNMVVPSSKMNDHDNETDALFNTLLLIFPAAK